MQTVHTLPETLVEFSLNNKDWNVYARQAYNGEWLYFARYNKDEDSYLIGTSCNTNEQLKIALRRVVR